MTNEKLTKATIAERRVKVFQAAIEVAKVRGVGGIRNTDIGEILKISPGNIMWWYGANMETLRQDVIAWAKKNKCYNTVVSPLLMKKIKRSAPAHRREFIRVSALETAKGCHYMILTREDIAEHAGISPALVSNYLGRVDNIRNIIVDDAIEQGVDVVIAQALSVRDPRATRLSKEVKTKAVLSLIQQ